MRRPRSGRGGPRNWGGLGAVMGRGTSGRRMGRLFGVCAAVLTQSGGQLGWQRLAVAGLPIHPRAECWRGSRQGDIQRQIGHWVEGCCWKYLGAWKGRQVRGGAVQGSVLVVPGARWGTCGYQGERNPYPRVVLAEEMGMK